ncbi:hypothetical protein METBIDRAFT_153289 [Metschnikowia bicuspidata var. bicuspidata NRRL YB-4993]|uniref:Uncharacterized protein n=1 Tax=Metschnikowia bicuspidata var. bicuspidata NRRL YB-4993 TaxID=869754 RepID=A0A1A0HEV7_9ASCO|nr:hypothetical protein METBIDRAFT_153289 [Metschnikowia bicuspidata var. bicuspidata NRRL YB-4993]OBA22422.1 hypothetical protein METBIDRAFT_153289 [Metschnikowia bicuspidata var. bicuspidata NRRL YB-4993]
MSRSPLSLDLSFQLFAPSLHSLRFYPLAVSAPHLFTFCLKNASHTQSILWSISTTMEHKQSQGAYAFSQNCMDIQTVWLNTNRHPRIPSLIKAPSFITSSAYKPHCSSMPWCSVHGPRSTRTHGRLHTMAHPPWGPSFRYRCRKRFFLSFIFFTGIIALRF